MASVQSKVMMYFLKRVKSRAFKLMDNHEVFRKEKEKIFSNIESPKSVKVQYFDMDGIEAARFLPPQNKYAYKVVLYLHGGGYTCGSIKSHAGLIGKLALETGIPHIAINYRLAPEHQYPAALDDAIKAYQWLLEFQRFNPKDIIIMGDSAGGGLTLATLLKIKELELPYPLTAVALSPWTDLTVTGDSALNNPERDPILDVAKAREWAKWYAGAEDLKNPFISPLYGNFHGLPPMLIHVGTEEILRSDAIQMTNAAKLKQVDVTLYKAEEMSHVWHFFWQYLPEAKEAIQHISDYLAEQITTYEEINAHEVAAEQASKSLVQKTVDAAQLSFDALKLGRKVLRDRMLG